VSPLFGRRKPPSVYDDLRGRVLALDPAEAGLAPSARHPRVYGGLLETGLGTGTFTLVCLADGTTSLYLSSGGGTIGGGEHPPVAAATLAFLDALEAGLDGFGADRDDAPPRTGRAVLRALTYDGRRGVEAEERALGEGRDPASPVFYAAHDVITALRLVDERR
jgi:hypothetical protein